MSRPALVALVLTTVMGNLIVPGSTAHAAKPEDIFKGEIIITKDRLPSSFSTQKAFVSAIRKNRTDRVWPSEQKGNDHALWTVEYLAFFAQPVNDYEVGVKFYDVTGGQKRIVAGDQQMVRDKGARVWGSSIQLGKPEFDVNKKYLMTVESRGRIIASTTFWLRGKQSVYDGKVEFSDDDTKGR